MARRVTRLARRDAAALQLVGAAPQAMPAHSPPHSQPLLRPRLYFHERLLPRQDAFELLPDIKELITNAFWRYDTRDHWKGYLRGDPTTKLSWAMVKQLVRSSASHDGSAPASVVGPAIEGAALHPIRGSHQGERSKQRRDDRVER